MTRIYAVRLTYGDRHMFQLASDRAFVGWNRFLEVGASETSKNSGPSPSERNDSELSGTM